MTGTARAMLVREIGAWDAVRLETIPVPRPGPGQVVIAAEAASVNFPDQLIVQGRYQHKPPLPFIPGRDVSGRILEVGEGVHDLAPGDRVAAQPPWGCFSTHVVSDATFCVRIPDGLGAIEAAAANTVVATVVAALGIRANVQPGELVLVTGAAGGVGSAAIQYARLLGAEVAAVVSSAEKEAAARDLGATIVLRTDGMADQARELRDALRPHAPDGAHVAIDMVGGDTFDGALRCLRPGGRCIVVGFAGGRIPTIAANTLLLRDIAVIGSSLDRMFRTRDPTFLRLFHDALQAVADGRLRVPVEACYPLADAHAAIAWVAGRHAVGKVVLHPME